MFTLDLFPARDGDALVLTWGDPVNPKRILIDAGREAGWPEIKAAYADLPRGEDIFELLVVSHIDSDHIAGVLKMLADPERPIRFKEIWFNAFHHLMEGDWDTFGAAQGEALSDMLRLSPQHWNARFGGHAVVVDLAHDLPSFEIAGLNLTLLSPTRDKLVALVNKWKAELSAEQLGRAEVPPERPDDATLVPEGFEAFGPKPDVETLAQFPESEDRSPANGSSIAFIAEFEGKRALLAADAHPSVLVAALERLPAAERKLDLVKLSHHGSKNNFSRAFFDAIACDRYAISTNGAYHDHPDPEMIARLIKWQDDETQLYFNYRSNETAIWDDDQLRQTYSYVCHYAPQQAGRLTISI